MSRLLMEIIFKTAGLNPILPDQNLQFQLHFLFLPYKMGVKTTNDEISWLEPKDSTSEQANLKNNLKSTLWCG